MPVWLIVRVSCVRRISGFALPSVMWLCLFFTAFIHQLSCLSVCLSVCPGKAVVVSRQRVCAMRELARGTLPTDRGRV